MRENQNNTYFVYVGESERMKKWAREREKERVIDRVFSSKSKKCEKIDLFA